ncbi:DNA polymerase epsilon catalytic subunit [Kappamyces sp. JEL0680]|nr:DNA polymerase epsilon catalytic subunit [Kappamyces sp. JEL0680]
MRKAARWYSMEMAGIVCLTGAKIIQLARQRVERVGKPLELDTDGIWCVLPASFPENFTFLLEGGKSYTISYPCVMLNHLVHDQFTNHQYQELIDPTTFEYSTQSENSIFFEVDGPYKAMILPASLEEGKLLKKRYAVFNDDGTIAELKGFELKRRGELKLIKNFQGSIFKVFLEGGTLEECYSAVAGVANRWLDIIYSKGADLTDSELFDLVSENRSMSKNLESYGAQKSTSITTAKRLAEFLGDQMVQEKGLNCHFIITTKPLGAPVSERAVPITIFQSDDSVKRHFLRKWLRDNSFDNEDVRDLIDWEYYLERFAGTIQKLITIPAALQNIPNPIPRVAHPDWVAKLGSKDKSRQRNITDLFLKAPPRLAEADEADNSDQENQPFEPLTDVEDLGKPKIVRLPSGKRRIMMKKELQGLKVEKTKKPAKKKTSKRSPPLQNPHNMLVDYSAWLEAQKPLWLERQKGNRQLRSIGAGPKSGISNFFESSASLMVNRTWEMLQVSETDSLGIFRVWAIVNEKLESIDVEVPRVFFVNSRVPAPQSIASAEIEMTRRNRILPRNHQCLHLYEMKMTEFFYRNNTTLFSSMFNHKDVEGVYETQVPLLFRALIQFNAFGMSNISPQHFDRTKPIKLEEIQQANKPSSHYLRKGSFTCAFMFHSFAGSRQFVAVFSPLDESLAVYFVDAGLSRDTIPPAKRLYGEMRSQRPELNSAFLDFPEKIEVSSTVVASEKEALTLVNRQLLGLKSATGGKPLILLLQSAKSLKFYRNSGVAALREFPTMLVATHKLDSAFPAIGWQRYALDRMFAQLFTLPIFIEARIGLARYGNVPVCNIENDYNIFLADLFYARRLKRLEHVMWCSPSSKPDLGGSEQDDNRSVFGDLKCPEINVASSYDTMCIELSLIDLSLNTIIKSHEYSSDFDQSAAASTTKGSIHLVDSHFAAVGSGVDVIQHANADQESTHHAFVVLRAMIKDWSNELKNNNEYAGYLIDNLHRWITSSSSLFFDNMVVYQIHNMMKRSLALIVDEIRRLGSHVVYASFDKLVLATAKTTLQQVTGYFAYVNAAIVRNPSFEHVEFRIMELWDYLVWYDPFNYGCIRFSNSQGTTEYTSPEDMTRQINLHWNVAEFLPAPVQQTFLAVVAEYLDTVRMRKDEGLADLQGYLTAFVDRELKQSLFGHVKDIARHRLDVENEFASMDHPFAFPRLPGSCRVMTNPALEFIKMMCMVLGLNKQLETPVRSLKRDLLRLIDVREFSQDAVFTNSCEKYILPQVICQYCNFGCDLDLTRKEGRTGLSQDDPDAFLVCEKCYALYDREDIEQRLVLDLQSLLCRWQLQDMRCTKCRLIKAEELRANCARCTGAMETVLSPEQFLRQIRVLSNLADYFRMPELQEAAAFVQSLLPKPL